MPRGPSGAVRRTARIVMVAHLGAEGNPRVTGLRPAGPERRPEQGGAGSGGGNPGAEVDGEAVRSVRIGHQPRLLAVLAGLEPATDLAVEAVT